MQSSLAADIRRQIWYSFLNEWGELYDNVKHILSYLNTYPGLLTSIKLSDIHNCFSIDEVQKEWIWLCSKFNHPNEKEFFRPYWIPIQVDSYDYFLDLSDNKYPIFEIHFFFYEPFRWYKKFIITDITELLLAPDTGLNLRKVLNKNDKIRWNQVSEYFEERRQLGYEGKIYVKPVTIDEIILKNADSHSGRLNANKEGAKGSWFASLIAGILPFDTKIGLESISVKYGSSVKQLEKVKLIRDLVFLLRASGYQRIESYKFNFIGSADCYFEFYNISFTLNHNNQKVIRGFVKAYNSLQ